jgi:hypothetical protein
MGAEVPPTPHDDAHLIVIHPAQWLDAKGAPAKTDENPAAVFDKAGVVVDQPVSVRFSAKHAGTYTLWVRVGQQPGEQSPLTAQIFHAGQPLLEGPINHDNGKPGAGGAEGYRAYLEKAVKNTPNNVVGDPSLIKLRDLSGPKPGPKSRKTGGIEDDLSDDLLKEMRAPSGENWVNTTRVDLLDKAFPFYWWKVGPAKLDAGDYELRISPKGAVNPAAAPLVDAAILTTYDKLVYPYVGDINAPRASYIRFRLDKIPADGLAISAYVNTHVYPYFGTGTLHLNPSGMSELKTEKHKTTGFTRWYCLQDAKRMVAFDSHECTLRIMEKTILAKGDVRGATQFSVFPHGDAAVRTIGWDEPDGLFISMSPDFEGNQHLLRTARDHARELYERALAAADNRPHALVRPGLLSLTNSTAVALGEDYDYLIKAVRLLGFNSVGVSHPLKSRTNYGGMTSAGTSWDMTDLPFDEEKTRRKYESYYRADFKPADEQMWKGVDIYQIADEPAEMLRDEMTAPLWRFETVNAAAKAAKPGNHRDDERERWLDIAGGSDLHTRKTDYSNCVLEGKVTKLGGWVGFRVAIDNPANPTHYAYWDVGHVRPHGLPENVLAGRVGLDGDGNNSIHFSLRPAVVYKDGPTPFKIVYEGTRAALYINGELAHEQKDLPPSGGFGITGPAKALSGLLIRPIHKGEHIAPDIQVAKELVEHKKEQDDPGDLDDPAKAADAAGKPLKELVEQEWMPAGGIPGAHEGFRRWAAARGLTPDLFGQKSWQDVHMLTVRELVRNVDEAHLYYWSRRYSGYLTPRMFKLAADGVRANAPNKNMLSFIGLSGHSLNFPGQMPLDMFEIANQGYPLMPGISDWMTYGGWRWDSHQSVAWSVAPMNSGARRWNADGSSAEPVSYPMMHCVYPNLIRSYTMLANQCKFISYYTFGPDYALPPNDCWAEMPESYLATSLTANRAGQIDDVLSPARMRHSRVALLYAHSTEYWHAQSSYSDRRAAFLALSHEYFQPELITEDQISDGALKHYDALYVMDAWVAADAQKKIAAWVNGGGLLWASADAMTHDEYNQPLDGLSTLAAVHREFDPPASAIVPTASTDTKFAATGPTLFPVNGEVDFRSHKVTPVGIPRAIKADGARVRAKYYETGMPAWLERTVGKGKVVYLAHRCGLTYTAKASRPSGYPDIWADTGRASLTLPLLEAKIGRELVLSQPAVMASPLTSENGTVIVLYNMRPVALKAVDVRLKEPARPVSVQVFKGLELIDLPFDYRDGCAVFTLPELYGGQMVLVRRKPAGPDNRVEELHQRTLAELDSKDADDVSAGAWFAGFHPEWKLGDRLVPLLNHARWEVRRSAAEALGRLHYMPAAPVLISAIHGEKDANVLGEAALALARLHESTLPAIARDLLQRDDPIIRRLAVQAAQAWLQPTAAGNGESDAAARVAATPIAQLALADGNLRVRRAGIALIVRVDPVKAVDLAIAAFADLSLRSTQERPDWVQALSSSDAAFAEYVRRDLPGGDEMLLALAAARAHPALAHAIESRLVELDTSVPGKVAAAAIRQGDKSLARRMCLDRSKLRPETVAYTAHVLEHAFDAQVGGVLEDWDAWLQDHPDGGNAAVPKP